MNPRRSVPTAIDHQIDQDNPPQHPSPGKEPSPSGCGSPPGICRDGREQRQGLSPSSRSRERSDKRDCPPLVHNKDILHKRCKSCPPNNAPAGKGGGIGGRSQEPSGKGGSRRGVAGNPSQVVLPEELKTLRQRGRIFHRLVTGIYWHRGKTFRFLTLTSSPRSGDIRLAWQHLVQDIRKTTPAHLALGGYLKGKDLAKYRKMVEPLTFEYCAVFTEEGHGVIHAIYAGDYLPFTWVQERWQQHHQAYGVNIKKVRPYSRKKAGSRVVDQDRPAYNPSGLANYMLQRYAAEQDQVRQVKYSQGWVYPGFARDWVAVKRKFGVKRQRLDRDQKKALIAAWHAHLDNQRHPQGRLQTDREDQKEKDWRLEHKKWRMSQGNRVGPVGTGPRT